MALRLHNQQGKLGHSGPSTVYNFRSKHQRRLGELFLLSGRDMSCR